MKIEDVAILCHEVNRAFCELNKDFSQVNWDAAPAWQKLSAINGVKFHLANHDARPCDSHNSWLKEKIDMGWKYGPVKDVDKKEHPCVVDFDQLPKVQQTKDVLFKSIVDAVRGLIEV